jgi:4-methoxybenzoate monooxygenase (O-demethylating)
MVATRTALTFDPFDPAVLADPYPAYEDLREAGAVVPLPDHGVWAVGRYDDVRAVLRDHETFSSVGGVGLRPVSRATEAGLILGVDPPVHTQVRRTVTRFFTPPAIAGREPAIRMQAAALIDAVLHAGPVDVVEAVAEPMATGVLCDLVGVPGGGSWDLSTREHHRRIAQYIDAAIDLAGVTGEREADRRTVLAETGDDLFDLAYDGMFQPGGIGAHLFGEVLASGELTEEEARFLLLALFVLGIDSMANLLGTALHLLATRPDVWAALRRDPSLVEAACEEILRYEPPVQYLFRTATRDVEIEGTTIPAGARVLAVHGAANHDPRHYRDPDVFDVQRFAPPNTADQLAFGHGVHLCLGATLARLEARLLLEELLARVAALELAGEPERKVVNYHRGYRHLPLCLYGH